MRGPTVRRHNVVDDVSGQSQDGQCACHDPPDDGERGSEVRGAESHAHGAIRRSCSYSGRAAAGARAAKEGRRNGRRRGVSHAVGVSRDLEHRAIPEFVELERECVSLWEPPSEKAATHINEHEVRVPSVLGGAGLDLLAKRADSARGVRRVRLVRVRGREARNQLVQEVIDEIQLRARVAVRPVHGAVKRGVRHIVCGLPDVRKLCLGGQFRNPTRLTEGEAHRR